MANKEFVGKFTPEREYYENSSIFYVFDLVEHRSNFKNERKTTMLTNNGTIFQYFVGLIIRGWICFRYLRSMLGRQFVDWVDEHCPKKSEKKKDAGLKRWGDRNFKGGI